MPVLPADRGAHPKGRAILVHLALSLRVRVRVSPMLRSTAFAFLFGVLVPSLHAQQWFRIETLNADRLTYGVYERKRTVAIDLSDLSIPEEYIGTTNPLNLFYRGAQDFKLRLLEEGYAELKSPQTATTSYKAAQDQAVAQRKGLWLKRLGPKTESPPAQPRQPATQGSRPTEAKAGSSHPFLESVAAFLLSHVRTILSIFSSIGITSLVVALYLQRRNQRKPRLLILGEASAGKSAVCLRLLKPEASQEDILGTKHTEVTQLLKTMRFIQFGPLQIYPTYIDVPGTEYGDILDELLGFRRPHLVVFVLAPTGFGVVPSSETLIDRSYLDVQFGVIKAQLEGALKSKRGDRPKAVILFINKFDLFSTDAPDDPKSSQHKTEILGLFRKHIENIKKAAGKVRVEVLVGSALRNWGFSALKECIGSSYGT